MSDFLANQPEEVRVLIVKAAVVLAATVAVALMAALTARRFRRSRSELAELREQIDGHTIDTLRTGTFTRADVRLWISNYRKSGTYCVLMTGQAAKEKDHDVVLPSAGGGSVYYLCIYHPGRQKAVRRRFIVADRIEPELDSLLREHAGSVVFR